MSATFLQRVLPGWAPPGLMARPANRRTNQGDSQDIGQRNGSYRHGAYTNEAMAASQFVRASLRLIKPILDEMT